MLIQNFFIIIPPMEHISIHLFARALTNAVLLSAIIEVMFESVLFHQFMLVE
jgi:hypothetical protein